MTPDRGRRRTVLHVFPTFEAGGAQLRVRDLVAADGDGDRHLLVTLDGGRTDPAALVGRVGAGGRFEEWLALPKAGSLATTLRLRSLLRRIGADLVLSYDWGAIDAVVANRLAARAPLIHHEDGVGDDESGADLRRRTLARRLVLRWADRVVVPSSSRERVALGAWKIGRDRLACIPNGIDVNRFAPQADRGERRARFGLPRDALVVGTWCRLARVKNLGRLLDAFARLDPGLGTWLVVAGDGAERVALERHAAGLPGCRRIRWLGHVAEPAALGPALDVWVLSSDREEHPRALVEAMACGCAVVATDVGDVRATVPGIQQPWLVDLRRPDSAGALAAALEGLLRDEAARMRLGRANREHATTRFPLEEMVARYRSLYESAIRRGRR